MKSEMIGNYENTKTLNMGNLLVKLLSHAL